MTIEQAIQKLINRNQQLVNKNGVTPYTRESEDIINTILAFYHISNDVLLDQRKIPIVDFKNNTINYLLSFLPIPKWIVKIPIPYRPLIRDVCKSGFMNQITEFNLPREIDRIEKEIKFIIAQYEFLETLPADLQQEFIESTSLIDYISFRKEDIPTIIRLQAIGNLYSKL